MCAMRQETAAEAEADESRARALFSSLDVDGSGVLEKEELVALHASGPEALAALDADHNGMVTLEEWMGFVRGVRQRSGAMGLRFLLRRIEANAEHAMQVREGAKKGIQKMKQRVRLGAQMQHAARCEG